MVYYVHLRYITYCQLTDRNLEGTTVGVTDERWATIYFKDPKLRSWARAHAKKIGMSFSSFIAKLVLEAKKSAKTKA